MNHAGRDLRTLETQGLICGGASPLWRTLARFWLSASLVASATISSILFMLKVE